MSHSNTENHHKPLPTYTNHHKPTYTTTNHCNARLSTFTSVIAILTIIRLVAHIYIQEPMNLCPVLSPVALRIYSHRSFSQSVVAVRIYSYRRSQSDRESQQHCHTPYMVILPQGGNLVLRMGIKRKKN